MKTAFNEFCAVMLLSSSALAATAQVNSHEIVWNTEDAPTGQLRLEVRNTSQVPVTAIYVEGQRSIIGHTTVVHSVRVFDSAVDPYKDHPLQPGETHTFDLWGPNPPKDKLRIREVKVLAVLFQDGGTWGEPVSINFLTSRRSAVLAFENAAMGTLLGAKVHSSEAGSVLQAIDQLKTQHQQRVADRYTRITLETLAEGITSSIKRGNQMAAQTAKLTSTSLGTATTPAVNSVIDQLAFRVHELELAQKHAD